MAEDQIRLENYEGVEREVEQWLDRFPRVPRELILERISALEVQLDRWQQALAVHDTLRRRNGAPAAPPQAVEESPPVVAPNKPKALLLVMAEQPDHVWKLSEARDVMVKRGWLPAGERGTHHLQTVAGKVKKRGHIAPAPERGPGYYRLTPAGLRAARE